MLEILLSQRVRLKFWGADSAHTLDTPTVSRLSRLFDGGARGVPGLSDLAWWGAPLSRPLSQQHRNEPQHQVHQPQLGTTSISSWRGIRGRDRIIKDPRPTSRLQCIRRPHVTMLPTLARRMAQAAGKATTTNTATASSASSISSPSRLKKVWPPDFSKLSKQEQLHFEKRYKRRVSHIAQRPRWNKMIQLAQLTTITCMGQAPRWLRGWILTVGSCRGVQRHVHGLEG